MRTLYITEEQERSLKNRVILAEADDRIKKVKKMFQMTYNYILFVIWNLFLILLFF